MDRRKFSHTTNNRQGHHDSPAIWASCHLQTLLCANHAHFKLPPTYLPLWEYIATDVHLFSFLHLQLNTWNWEILAVLSPHPPYLFVVYTLERCLCKLCAEPRFPRVLISRCFKPAWLIAPPVVSGYIAIIFLRPWSVKYQPPPHSLSQPNIPTYLG